MTGLTCRYDFVLLFDVVNGNPNGDPDAGNQPRMDPETGHGLVTDVSLKRKIRNYVEIARGEQSGSQIYVKERAVLNEKHRQAYLHVRLDDGSVLTEKNLNPKDESEASDLKAFMCSNFYDVRTFGAVMSTGINCGQVRGPVQLSFGRSIDPIIPLEVTITRSAASSKRSREGVSDDRGGSWSENRTMGRKYIIPYALYRVHGFVSASLARKTGFSKADLDLLWQALANMFDHDRTAARGEMSTRRLIVFEHSNALGNASAHDLFECVSVLRAPRAGSADEAQPRVEGWRPARKFSDYNVEISREGIPPGVTMISLV